MPASDLHIDGGYKRTSHEEGGTLRSSTRRWIFLSTALTAAAALTAASSGAGASGAKKPPPAPPPTTTPSATTAFIKNYADIVSGVEASATPKDTQPTADGGTINLGLVPSPGAVGVSWLTKLDATGAIQWQEEVGCLSTPPGAYSDAASLRGTKDGGYVIAGATIGCGSGANCPALSGQTCGLVEKLTSTGSVIWARVYSIGARETTFNAIRETSDGGLIAAGSATDASGNLGGLVAKLDGSGNLVWDSTYGPSTSFQSDFESVAQASDGGYVATGRLTATNGKFSLSVVKFDPSGALLWQHAYNNLTSGSPSSSVQPLAVIATSDGGYAIAGTFNSTSGPDTCCSGPLLLRLDSLGQIQFQQAYEGGLYCFFSASFSETCVSVGGVAYGLQQTKDGGFILAGDSNIEMADGAPLEPWLARVDASGQLIWQENDYRVNPQTGRPLSENFAGVAITNSGFFALGQTENYSNGNGELLGVSTDSDGHVATTCTDEHSTAFLSEVNPGLVDLGLNLSAVSAAATAGQSDAPVQTLATSGTASAPQC